MVSSCYDTGQCLWKAAINMALHRKKEAPAFGTKWVWFILLRLCSIAQVVLSMNPCSIWNKFKGTTRIETRADGREVQMLPQCYAARPLHYESLSCALRHSRWKIKEQPLQSNFLTLTSDPPRSRTFARTSFKVLETSLTVASSTGFFRTASSRPRVEPDLSASSKNSLDRTRSANLKRKWLDPMLWLYQPGSVNH